MENEILKNIKNVDLKYTIETSYIDYAMSVIATRALPDVRDGLKPVQRRILYSMIGLNNGPDKPYRKSARIVGDTMGKYHPHGDSSIYGALVNLAQNWNTRYPLIDGHGNFGSVDGDCAAAMRYTEARLSKISMEMIADINKDTVDFVKNFDETEKEPTVLPSRYPNILVNGTTGIAVGMATNIPHHNLKEVISAVVKIIDNIVLNDKDTSIEEILTIIKGPDFATGATIIGRNDIEESYRKGRGKIKIRAVSEIEILNNGKSRIVVTELPYSVNKSRLIEKIVELVHEKKIDGIVNVNDYSDREGCKIVIDLKRDINANIVLNQLYKHTQMQDTFGVNMVVLVDGEPKLLNILDILNEYLKYQESLVKRRTKYELSKAQERLHILSGLLIAINNIDYIIKLIKISKTSLDAKKSIINKFKLSDIQAQAIIDMRLKTLTGLEINNIENDLKELKIKIERLNLILKDRKLLLGIIKNEIIDISNKYGDERRTKIKEYDDIDNNNENFIVKENVVILITKKGYIKRMNIDIFKSQHRGGNGIKGISTIEDDYINEVFIANTYQYLLFFTNLGRVYKVKVYKIPEVSRQSRGVNIVNLLQLKNNEKIDYVFAIDKFDENKYLLIATECGMVKKTKLSNYLNIVKTGIIAINLRNDDKLVGIRIVEKDENVVLITKNGRAIKFKESDIKSSCRTSIGVKGIELNKRDKLISIIKESDGDSILFVSCKGMGKRTKIKNFKLQKRGGKGVCCYKITDKTGVIIGSECVYNDEIIIITNKGIVIRMNVSDIGIFGRNTSGVKLINIKDNNTFVASFTKICNI